MHYCKLLVTLSLVFGLSGCVSSNSNYYILSIASQPSKVYDNHGKTIGVEKITVPGYMYKRELAIATSSNQITLLGNAKWGEDLDEGLSNRLIGYLQKKFNQPNVYAYPWGIGTQPDIKVSIHISRFIALNNKVYLDATWSLIDMKTKKSTSKLFSTSVVTQSGSANIVSSMNSAFTQLEEHVSTGILGVR